MSLLVDPRICPDCRAPLTPDRLCTGCGLRLDGPLASELWQVMQTADALITRLRTVPAGAAPAPYTSDLPTAPPLAATPVRPRRGLSAGSVPTVLFGVGAICLLVAAVVFVAVAWSSLGLGARTAILLGVTGVLGALATRLTLRGLRGAAETFWLVVGAMVTIDLGAAYGAGLLGFDALAERHAAAVIGGALLALGLRIGTWVRRTELGSLVSSTVISTGGALLLVAGEAWAAPHLGLAAAVSVVALTGLAAGVSRLGLRTTAFAIAGVGVLSWAVLAVHGLVRAGASTPAAWWRDLEGWPLLVAALFAAATALAPRLPAAARTVAAAAAEVTLALLVIGPGAGPTTEIVVLAAITLALAGASVLPSRIWSLPAAGLAGLGFVVACVDALTGPLPALKNLPSTGPAHAANVDLRIVTGEIDPPASWTALVVVAVVIGVSLALLRRIPNPAVRQTAVRSWIVGAPTVAALGAATVVLESTPTLLAAVGCWAAVLGVLAVLAATVRGAWAPGIVVTAAYLGVVGLRLAVPSHLLVALLATALALGAAAGYRRTGADAVTRGAVGVLALAGAGFAATHWPYLFGATGDAAGIALVLVAAAGGLLASRVARARTDRVALEVTALVLGFAATGFPVEDAVTTAVLTVLGSAVALVSVLHRDRDRVGWLATAILGATALDRIVGHHPAPELVTAPAAALLILAGLHRLSTDPGSGSVRALGSGLTLALVPTLVLVLDEPVSVRGAVLALVALAVLALGIIRSLAAPFLAGAGVLAVLAVRHLGPVADALPRWISLGSVGALLLVVAITWESRRRELATAERYLTALR